MALNIPGMQRLARPVTSMYEGRALRQRERLAAQEEELNALKLDALKNPQPDPEEERKAAEDRREALESFQETGAEMARTQIQYEDSLRESGLEEDEVNTLLQKRWQQSIQTISETYGERFGVQFDADKQYDRAEAEAWLSQVEDKTHILSPGSIMVDSSGKTIAENPKDSGDQFRTIVDENGTPIAQEEVNTGRVFTHPLAPKPESQSDRQQKIAALSQRLQRENQLSQEDATERATSIIDGVVDFRTDPVSGTTSVTDLAAQTVTPVTPDFQPPQRREVQREETLWELANLAAGPVAAMQRRISPITGIVFGSAADVSIASKQVFDTEKNQLIRSLSINPRYPVAEMERVAKEVDIDPNAFTDASTLHPKMTAIAESLTRRAENLRQNAGDYRMSREQREADAASATAIEDFLNVLGVPSEAESEAPEGWTEEEWGILSREERERILELRRE